MKLCFISRVSSKEIHDKYCSMYMNYSNRLALLHIQLMNGNSYRPLKLQNRKTAGFWSRKVLPENRRKKKRKMVILYDKVLDSKLLNSYLT